MTAWLVAVLLSSAVMAATAKDLQCAVTFVVRYPSSQLPSGTTLSLMGSAPPLSWTAAQTLQPSGADAWRRTVTFPVWRNTTFPLSYTFKVRADHSTWEIGVNHIVTFANSSCPHQTVSVAPYFTAMAGKTYTMKNVYSPQLNNTRDVWIYAPPGYVENPYTVVTNVLVMQDGQNLEPLWGVNTHLDKHIAATPSMEPVFVVGPYNTPDRIAEYTYSVDPKYGGGKGDLYLDYIEKTLLPAVVAQFTGLEIGAGKQQNLGIMGSSLGGLISCYAAVTRPAVYGVAGCMSSSFWWNKADFLSTIVPKLTPTNSATQKFYMDSGDSGADGYDDDRKGTSAVATAFARFPGFHIGGNLFYYLERGGRHNEFWWSSRFKVPMEWLYYHDGIAQGQQ